MATKQIGTLAVGSIVKIKVGGVLTDFLVVHQGLPGSMYDSSCNGTWLLMKDCYEPRQWHSSDVNDYAGSDMNIYLNSDFMNKIDDGVRPHIKQVKIPYRPGGGTSMSVNSGANGLLCNVFLLGGNEVGWNSSKSPCLPQDGAKLAYFEDGDSTSA